MPINLLNAVMNRRRILQQQGKTGKGRPEEL
jgi:hypothetical protein